MSHHTRRWAAVEAAALTLHVACLVPCLVLGAHPLSPASSPLPSLLVALPAALARARAVCVPGTPHRSLWLGELAALTWCTLSLVVFVVGAVVGVDVPLGPAVLALAPALVVAAVAFAGSALGRRAVEEENGGSGGRRRRRLRRRRRGRSGREEDEPLLDDAGAAASAPSSSTSSEAPTSGSGSSSEEEGGGADRVDSRAQRRARRAERRARRDRPRKWSETLRDLEDLARLSAPDRALILAGFCSGATAASAQASVPHFLGLLVDAACIDRDPGRLCRLTLALLGAGAINAVAAGFRGYAFSLATARAQVRVRARLLESALRQDTAWHDKRSSGWTTSRLQSDPTGECVRIGPCFGQPRP